MNLALCAPALAASLVPSTNIANLPFEWPTMEEAHTTWIDVASMDFFSLPRSFSLCEFDSSEIISEGAVLGLFEAGSARSIELIAEARDIASLQDGWDGAGSVGASDASREQFLSAIAALPAAAPIPRTSVTSGGSLLLYWDERDFFLDMEFERDGTISFFARRKRGDERNFSEFGSLAEALPALEQLIEQLST